MDNIFFDSIDGKSRGISGQISGQISGIIDFYFSCEDALLYDVAVGIIALCCDENGHFFDERAAAFLSGYGLVRPEHANALAAICQLVAMRFFCTRSLNLKASRKTRHPVGCLNRAVTLQGVDFSKFL